MLTYTVNSLNTGTLYKFKVAAVNYIDEDGGPLSQEGAVIAALKPDAPNAPTKFSSTKSAITIQYQAPADDGGSAITAYKVLMNQGGASTTFDDISSSGSFDLAALRFTTPSTLTTGETYKFKLIVVNAVNESDQSS